MTRRMPITISRAYEGGGILHKMRTPGLFMTLTSITAVLFTASFPLRVSADILQFGPGALPGCAYQCKPLWSAQYDCPSEAVASECFCKSKYLTTLLQGAGGGGSICEDACPESGGGGADVRAWFEGVCASYLNQDQNQQSTTSSSVSAPTETTTATPTSPNPTDTTASPTATGTPNEGTNPNDPILSNNKQRLKAIDWYVMSSPEFHTSTNFPIYRLHTLTTQFTGGRKTGTGSSSYSSASPSP